MDGQTVNVQISGSLCRLGGTSGKLVSLMVGAPVPEILLLVIRVCTMASLL